MSLGALVVAPSLRSGRRQPRALGSLNRVVPAAPRLTYTYSCAKNIELQRKSNEKTFSHHYHSPFFLESLRFPNPSSSLTAPLRLVARDDDEDAMATGVPALLLRMSGLRSYPVLGPGTVGGGGGGRREG